MNANMDEVYVVAACDLTSVVAIHQHSDSDYGLTCRSTMCYCNFTTSNFVRICNIFMKNVL